MQDGGDAMRGAYDLGQYHPLDPLGAFDLFSKLAHFRAARPAFRTANAKYRPGAFFTHYADVAKILLDLRNFKNIGTDVRLDDYERIPPDRRIHIQLNPPEHNDVRRLALSAVSPPTIKRVLPLVEKLGDEIVSRFKARGRAEMVAEWAGVFPGLATALAMGVSQEDGPQLPAWVLAQFADEVLKANARTGGCEDMRRVGVEMIPPRKNRPGSINRPVPDEEPGETQLRLPCQFPRRPFGREPDARDDDSENDDDLADQQPGWGYVSAPERTDRPDRLRIASVGCRALEPHCRLSSPHCRHSGVIGRD